jgi:hypothetical protein
MAKLRLPVAALALIAAAAFYIAPAAAAPPDMTPVPPQGVRIVLPSGAVIIIPVEPTTPMQGGANQDHMVGEDLC